MKKNELIPIHHLLSLVYDNTELEAPAAYDELNVTPGCAHKSKASHKKAVQILADLESDGYEKLEEDDITYYSSSNVDYWYKKGWEFRIGESSWMGVKEEKGVLMMHKLKEGKSITKAAEEVYNNPDSIAKWNMRFSERRNDPLPEEERHEVEEVLNQYFEDDDNPDSIEEVRNQFGA